VPAWVWQHLAALCAPHAAGGPQFLWQTWEKHHLTSRIVNRLDALRTTVAATASPWRR
jgi:hypothetical protein